MQVSSSMTTRPPEPIIAPIFFRESKSRGRSRCSLLAQQQPPEGVGNQTAGTNITLKDSNENILFDFSPELPYNVVILSSPDMISGETYTVTVGTSSSSFEAK